MNQTSAKYDVVLIGAGIMSATLGVLLHRLQPNWNIAIFERLEQIAAESSDAWNNAGTGHAAYCELNYTSVKKDGTIDCSKALKINEQFEISKQFWSYLIEDEIVGEAKTFINKVPHYSFVKGEEDVEFLRARHKALSANHLFAGMEFSDDPQQVFEWIPLLMNYRDPNEKVAATRVEVGSDINFGSLSRQMFQYFENQDNTTIFVEHEVQSLKRNDKSGWRMSVNDLKKHESRQITADFIFIGAGGGALTLLEKSDIPEAQGYGGFPVSGQWLRCTNEAIIEQHHAKVYGKAGVGTPPMSVPHLDTRIINGKKELLFGPFAGFTTKFLKQGSYLDFFRSIEFDNIVPMLEAGWDNIPLTKYLIQQALLSHEDRVEAVKDFIPNARLEDWELKIAGQRVQVIKDSPTGGILEFGTELVHAHDGSLAALLGASPGASTSVSVMLNLLEKCFPEQLKSPAWQQTLKTMLPSHGSSLPRNAKLCYQIRKRTNRVLGLG
jgi:malate dehydrogenase (quinone)